MTNQKELLLKELEEKNPEAEIKMDNAGFIRFKHQKKEISKFLLPVWAKCPEGIHFYPNEIKLYHLYSSDGDFIVTMITQPA